MAEASRPASGQERKHGRGVPQCAPPGRSLRWEGSSIARKALSRRIQRGWKRAQKRLGGMHAGANRLPA